MPTPIQELTALEQAEGRKHIGKVIPEVVQGDEGPVPAPKSVAPKPVTAAVTPTAPTATTGSLPEFLRRVEADLELAAKKLGG